MPIDVNKIIPNKNLAILDGILKGVSGMKKAEEEKQQAFIKNMFEQFKLQQENRKIEVSERLATVSEQRMQDEFQYKNAMLENAYKEIDIKIANQTLDEKKFAQAVTEAGFPYLEKKQEIMNNPKFSQEDKIVRLTAEQKLINDEMLEKRKAETAQLLEDKRQTGRMEVASVTQEGANARAKLSSSTQLRVAGMSIMSRENEGLLNRELKKDLAKDKTGAVKVNLGNYMKLYTDYSSDYENQLKNSKGDQNKISDADKERLSNKAKPLMDMYITMKEKYPDQDIPEPANIVLYTPKVEKKFAKDTKSKLETVSGQELIDYQLIMKNQNLLKGKSKDEAEQMLNNAGGYDTKAIQRVLRTLYNE